MPPVLLVAIGSAAGGVARWAACSILDPRLAAWGLPWGTVLVNIAGSLAIGACAALCERDALRLLLMTGLLGGFTTFSAFSLQTVKLMQDGRWLAAGAHVGISVAACVLACWAGWAAVQALRG